MSWKKILKNDLESDLKEDLLEMIATELERFGEDKMREDYEDAHFESGVVMAVVDFQDGFEGEEDLTEEEIFEMDEGYYTIEFKDDAGDFALAEYTYNDGYKVVENDLDEKHSLEMLKRIQKGLQYL